MGGGGGGGGSPGNIASFIYDYVLLMINYKTFLSKI